MITPPFLNSGDLVSIVAPAGRVNKDDLDAAVKILQRWGLKVKLGEHVYSEKHSYLAGTDEERLADLQNALDDTQVRAVLCARGGYGITRVVDKLEFEKFFSRTKWVVGFSDITALLLKLNKLGCESIHGTMPKFFTHPDALSSLDSLRAILFAAEVKLAAPPNHFNRPGVSEGEVVGGNLSLLTDSLGTSSELDTNRKILLLEEIEEHKYKVDRMMVHLKRAGKLSNLAGLVIGHMSSMLETTNPFGETVEEIVLGKVKEFDYPVAFGFPIGHDYPNIAWRFGAKMELIVAQQGSMLSAIRNS